MKKKLYMYTGGVLSLLLLPAVSFAQQANLGWFGNVFQELTNLIDNILIPLVFALAILAFFWGVFTYFILGGGDEGKREQGRQLMLYAIIGFVVMVSLFGIIDLIAAAFGVNTGGGPIGLPGLDLVNP